MLLRLRHRLTDESARRCRELFTKLAENLMKHFKGSDPDERQVAFLMVYDPDDLHLHTVLTHPPVTSHASLKLPLGEGVAGAAFLSRQVLAWEDDPHSDTLIKPKPLPAWGLPARHVLALPIYHQAPLTGQLNLEPGAVIGVVTLGSGAAGSKIVELQDDEEKAVQAQLLAQGIVTEMLAILSVREGTVSAATD
jgi:hypothetical protein